MNIQGRVGLGLALALVLAAGACDAGGKAEVTTRDAGAPLKSERRTERAEAVPLVDGKPMWAANSRGTAQENAKAQFERNGADFSAANLDAYVARAHAFTAEPPRGTETLTRPNGDVLLYDGKANVFAVVAKDGAPRTMFKPRDGADYWREQKARQASNAATQREG